MTIPNTTQGTSQFPTFAATNRAQRSAAQGSTATFNVPQAAGLPQSVPSVSSANSAPSDAQPGRLRLLRKSAGRMACWAGAAGLIFSVSGCGLAAFPCRVVSATLKVVPGVGGVAATPFDTCASAID